jgi:hypothetical protein
MARLLLRAGLTSTGTSSMRAYINHGLIGPAIFAVIFFGIAGAIMGSLGGMVSERLTPSSTGAPRPGPGD